MAAPQVQQNIQYELPKLVESVRTGWIVSAQAIAVVGALFSAGETALIPFVKTAIMDEDGTPRRPAHPGLFKLLLIVSYGAFLFNASATISSLILIDKLGEMPFLNREKALRANQHLAVPDSANRLLRDYELRNMWYWIQGHCLISLLLGCLCIFLQFVLYTWLNESHVVFVITVFVAVWCLLPLVLSLSDSIHSARNVREIRPS